MNRVPARPGSVPARLGEQPRHQDSTGRAVRVAQGQRAAVEVCPLGVNAEGVQAGEGL